MSKKITLELNEEIYNKLLIFAKMDNINISKLIERIIYRKLQEDIFVDDFEMQEIMNNKELSKKLTKGSEDAKNKRGRLVI